MRVRYLLPLVAAFAVLFGSFATWAAAGVDEPACCCPDPKLCKCHADSASHAPIMKRCSGKATLVVPELTPALPPSAPPGIAVTSVAAPAPPRHDVELEPRFVEPETPPF